MIRRIMYCFVSTPIDGIISFFSFYYYFVHLFYIIYKFVDPVRINVCDLNVIQYYGKKIFYFLLHPTSNCGIHSKITTEYGQRSIEGGLFFVHISHEYTNIPFSFIRYGCELFVSCVKFLVSSLL